MQLVALSQTTKVAFGKNGERKSSSKRGFYFLHLITTDFVTKKKARRKENLVFVV